MKLELMMNCRRSYGEVSGNVAMQKGSDAGNCLCLSISGGGFGVMTKGCNFRDCVGGAI